MSQKVKWKLDGVFFKSFLTHYFNDLDLILLQSATLTNGVESKNSSGDNSGSSNSSDDSSDDDEDKFKRLTDEELFKACGGLTAHKYGFSL